MSVSAAATRLRQLGEEFRAGFRDGKRQVDLVGDVAADALLARFTDLAAALGVVPNVAPLLMC